MVLGLQHFGIRRQLFVLVSVFMVPVATLAWLLTAQSSKDIRFAHKELDGRHYLTAIHALVLDLAAGRLPVALDALSLAESRLGLDMDSRDSFEAAAQAIRAANAAPADLRRRSDALLAMRTLTTRIGDSSNLILDPDLDSYYTMSIVVLRMPDVLSRAAVLHSFAHEGLRSEAAIRPDSIGSFLAGQGMVMAALDGMASDLAAGLRGNTDGQMRAALAAPWENFRAAAARWNNTLSQTRVAGGAGGADATELDAAHNALVAAAGPFWQAAADELERLLHARIGGFYRTLTWSLLLAAGATVLALTLAALIARFIGTATLTLRTVMTRVSEGDLSLTVPLTDHRNEIGAMARAVEVFRRNAEERAVLLAAQDEAKRQAAVDRQNWLHNVSSEVERMLETMQRNVGQSNQQFDRVIQALSANSLQTENRVSVVTSATDQAAGNTGAAASVAEDLAQSIRNIGQQAEQSTRTIAQAAEEARHTDRTVRSLSESSSRIGEVVKLIHDIASQTNLLALNATIEAARAGEAGKGFAVVASEVKSLASQTARATEDIAQQVAAVQAATQEAVQAIDSIGTRIAEMQQVTATIAAAVEEQTAATGTIVNRVQQASVDTQDVNGAIGEVANAATETSGLVRELLTLMETRRRNAEAFFNGVANMVTNLRSKG